MMTLMSSPPVPGDLRAPQVPQALGLRCLQCGSTDSRVIDKRNATKGYVRRRRECACCGARYTTREIVLAA